MGRRQKRWSKSEKLSILSEAQELGVLATCRRHEVSTATYYNWKRSLAEKGESAFSGQERKQKAKLSALEAENRRLRKLLVDKDLALEVQKELLKKKFGTDDPRQI